MVRLSDYLPELVLKISRLRSKLISFGFSSDEVKSIVLEEFLKLPKIDWSIKNTTMFYQLKEQFQTDSNTIELIMCLRELVPQMRDIQVSEYMLNILQYNSLAFGLDLSDSSSDSSEVPCYKKFKTHLTKFQTNRIRVQKRMNDDCYENSSKKKIHMDGINKKKQCKRKELQNIRRTPYQLPIFDETFPKIIKKEQKNKVDCIKKDENIDHSSIKKQ